MAEIWHRAGADVKVLETWLLLKAHEDDVHCYEVLPEADC